MLAIRVRAPASANRPSLLRSTTIVVSDAEGNEITDESEEKLKNNYIPKGNALPRTPLAGGAGHSNLNTRYPGIPALGPSMISSSSLII